MAGSLLIGLLYIVFICFPKHPGTDGAVHTKLPRSSLAEEETRIVTGGIEALSIAG